MKQAMQVELLKNMLDMIDNHTTVDAGRLVKNPTSSYVCKDLAKREWAKLFANHPQVLGLSGELPKPGSFVTNNYLGIPILATRDKSDKFHAFVNACRHRTDLKDEAVTKLDGDSVYQADMSTRIEFNLATQMEIINSTLEMEDYHMGAKSQQTAECGKVEHFIFGRNEPALHHFHANYRDALGMPPLEEYYAG